MDNHLNVFKKITAFSLDVDGCLFPTSPYNYYAEYVSELRAHSGEPTLFLKYNQDTIDWMKQLIENEEPECVEVFLGSTRQSVATDFYNSLLIYIDRNNFRFSESAFDAIQKIVSSLKTTLKEDIRVQLNPLLFNDIANQQSAGTTYKKIKPSYFEDLRTLQLLSFENEQLDPTFEECMQWYDTHLKFIDGEHSFEDTSKFLILYAQLHELAQHPNTRIQFHFIDDQYEILTALKQFFEQSSSLQHIPHNTTLHLHAKHCSVPFQECAFKGTGSANGQYTEIIHDWIQLYQTRNPFSPRHGKVLYAIAPQLKIYV